MIAAAVTLEQELAITTAVGLVVDHDHVLANFEIQTIAEVADRYLDHGPDTVITAAEWVVIDQAVKALREAAARPLASRGQA